MPIKNQLTLEVDQMLKLCLEPEVELKPEKDSIANAQWGLLKGAETKEKVVKAYQTVSR